ncbi:unnamed protein product [Meloidogyne enterolobii]|uniref:Uncharacterized protein n=1 Tax=Meloidogyne enterolobii TaxID=390850 RepID=A0ACB0Y856_MELEN
MSDSPPTTGPNTVCMTNRPGATSVLPIKYFQKCRVPSIIPGTSVDSSIALRTSGKSVARVGISATQLAISNDVLISFVQLSSRSSHPPSSLAIATA